TDFIADVDIAEVEARFYHFIEPGFKGAVPLGFFSDWDGDGSGQGVVMMEDVGAEGGVFGHSSHHIGVDSVAHVLASLAKMHVAWWGRTRLDGFEWLLNSMNTLNDDEQFRFMRPFAEQNMAKPEDQAILPEWMYDSLDPFSATYDALVAYERSSDV